MSGSVTCPKVNEVSDGVGPYTAQCEGGSADVYVYVHDGKNSRTEDNADVPDTCEPSQDQGKKVDYKFNVPCTSVSGGVSVEQSDGTVVSTMVDDIGENALQTIPLGVTNVEKLTVSFGGGGAVNSLSFCRSLWNTPAPF